MSENAITTTDNGSGASIMPAVSTSILMERYQLIKEIRDKVMVEGEHFGVVPGTSGKPTLYKPGAEVLCTAFALYPEFEALDEVMKWDADEPFFFYRYRCTLKSRDGRFTVGSGIGSCNSRETKYRYRTAKPTCPTCGADAIMKSTYKPGWYCNPKWGGCGANHAPDAVDGSNVGRIPNPDIADQVNTIDKMAQKRALVAATLVAVGASNFFTQDVEDLPDFGGAREAPAAAPEPPQDAVDGEVVEDAPQDPEKAPSAAQGGPTVTVHDAPRPQTGKPYYDDPRPHKPEVIRAYFADAEKNDTKENPREPLDNETRQTIFLKVAGLFPDELTRKRFQLWAFGVSSIADMTNGQGRAYWVWADKPDKAKRELDDIMASASWAGLPEDAAATG